MRGWRRRSACSANAERLFTGANAALDLLYEAEVSAESLLGGALKHVEDLARFDERFRGDGAAAGRGEGERGGCGGHAAGFCGHVTASPERLGEIEDRLAALERLKRKYGAGAGTTRLAR